MNLVQAAGGGHHCLQKKTLFHMFTITVSEFRLLLFIVFYAV